MSGTNFQTGNDTFRKLFGNGLVYSIPRFQRDYSWTDTEWEELWDDLLECLSSGHDIAHYLGYLVLQSDNSKSFDVIDGQQRLTTLSIIILAVMRNLQKLVRNGIDAEQNQIRLEQIRSSYIGYLDPVTLISKSKLTLNRNNNAYYQNYLVTLSELPQRGFKASEHLMRKASDWFEKRIWEYANHNSGKKLAELVEVISDKFFFTVITVNDELNAYKVFETLNARGVRLSATDLLKNYLFSVLHKDNVHETEMQGMDNRWEQLVTRLGESDLPDFLRIHWISRYGSVRKSELFKVIRREVNDRAAVFSLLANLDSDIDSYLGLNSPLNSEWDHEVKKYAEVLRIFGVRQHYAISMAAKRRLSSVDFTNFMKHMVTMSLRYNVIGNRQANEQERVYADIAIKLSNGEYDKLTDILERMRSIYPRDDEFRGAFSSKQLKTTQARNNKIVKYLLCNFENTLTGIEPDQSSSKLTVEHILPQNPDRNWDDFSEQDIEDNVYRIGNMTILEANINREIQNREYEIKKPAFAQSEFQITKNIVKNYDDWDASNINSRQKQLAKMATSIWRIPQLS